MDTYIHILKCLLHYHERMMMGMVFSEAHDKELCNNVEDGKCAKIQFADNYADALKEAIRCIEIVHKDELNG